LIGLDTEKTLGRVRPRQFLRQEIEIPGSNSKSFDPHPQGFVTDWVVWR
jgi:hypothetical protein